MVSSNTTLTTSPDQVSSIPLEELKERMYAVWFKDVAPGPTPLSQENQERQLGIGTRELRDHMDDLCRTNFEDYLIDLDPTKLTTTTLATYAEELKWGEQFAVSLESPSLSKATAPQLLSLVLLLDQIPRNIYRKKQKLAYCHYDPLCRSLIRLLFSKGLRPDLDPELRYSMGYRMWFYLPFMHSEHLEDHRAFDEYFKCMRDDIEPLGNADLTTYLDQFAQFERKHVVILQRFGRYPHRNVHIGRTQTVEETAFLDQGDSWFGTKS